MKNQKNVICTTVPIQSQRLITLSSGNTAFYPEFGISKLLVLHDWEIIFVLWNRLRNVHQMCVYKIHQWCQMTRFLQQKPWIKFNNNHSSRAKKPRNYIDLQMIWIFRCADAFSLFFLFQTAKPFHISLYLDITSKNLKKWHSLNVVFAGNERHEEKTEFE